MVCGYGGGKGDGSVVVYIILYFIIPSGILPRVDFSCWGEWGMKKCNLVHTMVAAGYEGGWKVIAAQD